MSARPVDHALKLDLSPEELGLVLSLRELPDGRLRQRALVLVRELVEFARAPRCNEVQADGVPCPSAQNSCDQCVKVDALIEVLRHRLREGV